MGKRESVPDVARNLSRWVDGVAARVFSHRTLEQLAAHASIPVINGLSDSRASLPGAGRLLHAVGARDGPGQAPAGAGWATATTSATRSCCWARCSAPARWWRPRPATSRTRGVLEACRAAGRADPAHHRGPARPIEDADVIYTDTWISMGQEGDREQRLEAFQRYQVNDRLLGFAPGNALVMHCLPAHRGRGDHRRGAGRPAQPDPRAGREPPARAEGDHPEPAGRGPARDQDGRCPRASRRSCSRTRAASTPRSSCAGSSRPTAARSWPTAPTWGRARS